MLSEIPMFSRRSPLERALLTLMLCAALAALPEWAQAQCGAHASPDNNDIQAILLTQNGCGNTIQGQGPHIFTRMVGALNCSTFWALFWETPPARFPTVYNQFSLKDSVGGFELSATLHDAIAVLQKDRFWDLEPNDYGVTDTAEAILYVRRCSVVTIVHVYNGASDSDADAMKVFDDLRGLVERSTKTKTSEAPETFPYESLFFLSPWL